MLPVKEKENEFLEVLKDVLDGQRLLLKEVSLLRRLVASELDLKRHRESVERDRAAAFLESMMPPDS